MKILTDTGLGAGKYLLALGACADARKKMLALGAGAASKLGNKPAPWRCARQDTGAKALLIANQNEVKNLFKKN